MSCASSGYMCRGNTPSALLPGLECTGRRRDESGLRVFLLESRRSLDVGSVRRTKVLQTRRPLVAAPSNKAGGEHGAASELRDSEPQLTTTPASHTSYDLLLPSTSSSHPPDIAHVFPEAVALGQVTTGSRGETCCHEGC